MFKHTKIYRRHDINSFTGTHSNNFYQFTKQNGQTISCRSLEHLLDETDLVNFLGWQTEDILRAFPLKHYDSVTSAVVDLDFEWHESVSDLVIDTEYELLDSSSLKCTCYFESESAHTLILSSMHVLEDQVKAASEKKWVYIVCGGRAGDFRPKSGQNRNPQ